MPGSSEVEILSCFTASSIFPAATSFTPSCECVAARFFRRVGSVGMSARACRKSSIAFSRLPTFTWAMAFSLSSPEVVRGSWARATGLRINTARMKTVRNCIVSFYRQSAGSSEVRV